jgi:cytochrome P450
MAQLKLVTNVAKFRQVCQPFQRGSNELSINSDQQENTDELLELECPPSPIRSSFIPTVRLPWFSPQSTLVARLAEGFRLHGDVVQLSGIPMHRIFCFRHPEHIKQIYTHESIGTMKLPSLLPKVQWIMGHGTFIHPGGEDWRRRRRMVEPGLTRAASLELARLVPEATLKALERWQTFAAKGEPIEIHREMGRLIIDITLKCLFSENVGDKLDEVHEQTEFLLKAFASVLPVQLPLIENYRFRSVARKIQAFMHQLIEKRLKSQDRPVDVLTLLLSEDKKTGKPWSIQEVQDEMFSLFFGASIMKIPLAWACYRLSLHPHIQDKLTAEVKDVLAGRVPIPADLEHLPYSEMVFKETTRLYPPVWGFPRYANQEVQIANYTLPANTLLFPIGYFAHRHPEFWDNPEVFDPERFHPERAVKIHPFAHYPFGGGPRMCLGRNLAPIICRLILVMLAQRFSLTFVPRSPDDPQLNFSFELGPKNGIWLILREKSSI